LDFKSSKYLIIKNGFSDEEHTMSLTMPNNQYGNFVQGQKGGSVQMINSAGSFAVPGRVASQYQCINPGNVRTLRLQNIRIQI
jgi:hypothetical protein